MQLHKCFVGLSTCLFLLLLIPTSSYAEFKIYIHGRVTDAETGVPLPGATVFIPKSNIGCITTPNGYYRLIIPSDTVKVTFSFVGYENQSVQVTKETCSYISSEASRQPIEVALHPKQSEIDVVSVYANMDKIIRLSDDEVSVTSLSPKLIQKLPNFGEVDIMRSFQLLPGISGSNETSAGLYVRGGTPDQNLILFDGMSVYHVDHFYGFFSAFNANSIEDVKLYKGCFPAKYGGRLSSVMELKGKTAEIDQLNWSAGLSLLSVNGLLELPIIKDKLSLQLSARRSYTDIIKSGLYKNIFSLYDNTQSNNAPEMNFGGPGRFSQTVEPTFYFYDINAKLTWFAGDKDEVSFAFYNGIDNLDNSRENDFGGMRFGETGSSSTSTTRTIDLSRWGNVGASVQWKRDWSDNFNSQLFISYSNYFTGRQRGTESDEAEQDTTAAFGPGGMGRSFSMYEDNNVADFSISLDNSYQVNKHHLLEFGMKYTDVGILYQYATNDTSYVINTDNSSQLIAAYVQDKISLFNKLDINAGIRYTYYTLLGNSYLEPRLTVTYKINDAIKIDAGWGKYNQYIARTIREDIMAGSNDFWMLSDGENIPVSSSYQYLAGISYNQSEFLLSAEGYYKSLEGLSEFTMRFSNQRFDNSSNNTFFTGSGVAKGIEFLAQKKTGKLTGWIAYTLGSVIHNFPDLNSGKSFYALHDQTQELKIVATQSVRNWDFSATWIFATGTPYTAPEGIYELTLLDGTTNTYIHVGDKNAYRLPNYNRADISANFNFYIGNSRAVMGASVFNLLNHENIWYKEFDLDEETGDLYETNVKKLGFTPNLTFKLYLR